LKCSYANDTIGRGPMMWMSFAMERNRQEGKLLTVECKALKWVKENNAPPPQRLPWWVFMVDGMIKKLFSWLWWL